MLDMVRGFPGHPTHPPFTDAAIGIYTFSVAALIANAVGFEETITAGAAYYGLILGVLAALGAAGTGLLDYLKIPAGTPRRRVATYHLSVMIAATVLFAIAAFLLSDTFDDANVTTTTLIVGIVAFGLLSLGGWLGGTLVFVYGERVEGAPDTPVGEAISPMSSAHGPSTQGAVSRDRGRGPAPT